MSKCQMWISICWLTRQLPKKCSSTKQRRKRNNLVCITRTKNAKSTTTCNLFKTINIHTTFRTTKTKTYPTNHHSITRELVVTPSKPAASTDNVQAWLHWPSKKLWIWFPRIPKIVCQWIIITMIRGFRKCSEIVVLKLSGRVQSSWVSCQLK